MIKVETYIRQDDKFIPIAEYTGKITDLDYIEGSILLEVDNKAIFTQEMWDYVDQLWSYLVDGLVEVSKNNRFEVYFPDQPIKLILQADSNKKHVSINVDNDRSALVDYATFFTEITNKAEFFFKKLSELMPERKDLYQDVLNKIQTLKKAS